MQRQDWPRSWLLTDERMSDELLPALERAVSAYAGIIVRHYRSPLAVRAGIARRAQELGAVIGIAGDAVLARDWGADFVHNPSETVPSGLPFTLAVHNEAEALRAAALGPAFILVSPVYATRSHPGAAVLGEDRALKLAIIAGCPSIALGGMDASRGEALMKRGFSGWAGIDCWLKT